MSEHDWAAVQALERLADEGDEAGYHEAWKRADLPSTGIAVGTVAGTRMQAQMVVEYPMRDMQAHQCDLLRDMVQPFAPVVRVAADAEPGNSALLDEAARAARRWRPMLVWREAWATRDVLALAQAAYDERCADPVTLLALADALAEAGCPESEVAVETYPSYATCGGQGTEDLSPTWHTREVRRPHPLLAHLRGPGPHAMGCWALDLILGKE